MRTETAEPIERRSGVALWRQIADQIRGLAGSGAEGAPGRLPPETVLAARFGVNRHTVRSAIAQLVQEGVLRAEQGRGTFFETQPRLTYAIATRTRFSAGLEGQATERRSRLLAHATEAATSAVAEALALAPGARVVRLETLGEADGRPVSRATSFFDAARFAGVAERFAESGSITVALRTFGVGDYVRRSTVISARHAGSADLADMRLSPGAIVLVTMAVNDGLDGRPVQYSETRFAADRVELKVEAETAQS
ncbi:MAG: phosphonate metabolism transcriptional regulator PhnF [Mesorhizobium sp.]|nr:phosphonate metabolism transcriptional regulator PhnF [Mesorhizobium sp.]